jgi:hypothetical protein
MLALGFGQEATFRRGGAAGIAISYPQRTDRLTSLS